MAAVIRTHSQRSRFTLALSLAAFALAGLIQGSLGTTPASVPSAASTGVALAVTVAGVAGLARYVRSVTRTRHAVASIGLWAAFLVVAGPYAAGLESVASATPVPALTAVVLEGLAWATVLGAGTSTVFLGFREYGAGAATSEETALDQGSDV